MLVDLHAHYPMHLQPSERQLAHERLRQWEKEWLRALIVRRLSRTFNYEGAKPSVTLEEMEKGDVGVILSPLYSPFDEIDFTRRYGSKPRPGYFTELLDQLVLVEDHIEKRRNEGHRVTIAHSRTELTRALGAGEQVLIHAVEGGFHLGDEESEVGAHVKELAERGVAYITVAHLFWRGVATNAPALPFMPDWLYSLLFPQPKHVGLSSLGRAAVNAMVDHGVLVDITHMSERATIDTLDLLDERDPGGHVPVIATHMACRLSGAAATPPRSTTAAKAFQYNLPDSVLRRIAERKGLLGLIACKHYISGGAEPGPASFEESFELMRRHIDHIVEVTESDECVAFGSDLDGYIKPALPGLERLGEMRRFQERLADEYEARAQAFTSANALRVLEAAWGVPHPRARPRFHSADVTSSPPEPSGGGGAPDVVAFAVGLLAYLYLAGLLLEKVRLSSARLPADLAPDAFNVPRMIGEGLRATLLAAGVFALLCLVAYLASALHWTQNGPLWHSLVRRRAPSEHDGRTAPLGEVAVRILAGFNTVAIAALIALGLTRPFEEVVPDTAWLVVLIWLAWFLVAYFAMSRWAPAIWGRRLGGALWVAVALLALFASAPLGILALATVFVSTFGRVLMRLERPTTIRALVRSPLPWAVLASVFAVALAYQATPPESFPTAALATTSGEQRGAYLGRTGAGVYIASCSASQTDATSTGEHITFVPAGDVRSLEVRSQPYRFDSGKRPSLLTLAFHAVGGEGDTPTWFNADLRARAATCDGAGTEGVSNDPALGAGVLVGPGPPDGRALDGEPPIQDTSAPLIAALARRYEPTMLVTTADHNWPVSVDAILAERGVEGAKTCLVQTRAPAYNCNVTPGDLSPGAAGASAKGGDYLQLPTKLENDSTPEGQFEALMRGLAIEPGPPARWLTDPAVLKPWSTAQIYFYLAQSIDTQKLPEKARNPLVSSGLVGLEYWFYYPYNYYPAVVRTRLMENTPLASERLTVDRHQGDWEHMDVLLNPETLTPEWLYLARHSFEGQFIRWSNVALSGGHPVVQAAYGGHPTYEPSCGPQPRGKANAFLSSLHLARFLVDWLVCGSGRLAFPAQSTPLVDLATVPWACWPGHFGEASSLEVTAAKQEETLRDTLTKVVFVAGPNAPLVQAENAGVCKVSPSAGEDSLLARLQDTRPSSAGH